MTTLHEEDNEALLGLSRDAGADAVREAFKAIANRHGVDWLTWPTWSCGMADGQTPLSMAVTNFESESYVPIINFAFGPACHDLLDVKKVREHFKSFFGVIGMLMGFYGAPNGDAGVAKRVKACFAAFLLAAGPTGRPYAFASLTAAFPVGANEWLDDAWRAGAANREGEDIFGALTTLGAEVGRETL